MPEPADQPLTDSLSGWPAPSGVSRGSRSGWREYYVADERARGRTFNAIAHDLGISTQRAQQLHRAWQKRLGQRMQERAAEAERVRAWEQRVETWRLFRRHVEEVLAVVQWFRHRGGNEAFIQWERTAPGA